ncbi:MAG: hypothetical protein WD534_15530 [Phycisphaeraceae bacterium]
MNDRESVVVLAVCGVIAVAVHVAVLVWPVLLVVIEPVGNAKKPTREPAVDRELPQREPDLGDPASRTASMAWISHDDFRQLVAPQADTEQPAIQQDVDPADEAPLELDPTPPVPMPAPAEQAAPQADAVARLEEPPLAMEREVDPPPLELPEFDTPGPLPRPAPEPVAEEQAPQPDRLPAQTADAEQSDAPAPESPDARPTAAPRDDAEADPTQIDPREWEMQPGGVLVGPGLKIQTARPHTRPTMRTAAPRDTIVRLYFNADGEVDRAELLRSTGAADWDGAILTSLYRWRAEGEALQTADPHLVKDIPYRFH